MRNHGDLIEAIEEGMEASGVPRKFTRWAAVSMVAGALQKRVWYNHGAFNLYPNLFVVLIGRPGCGKSLSLHLPFDGIFFELGENPGTPPSQWRRTFENYGLKRPLFLVSDKVSPEQMQVKMSVGAHQVLTEEAGFDRDVEQSAVTLTTSEMATFIKKNEEKTHIWLTEMWDAKKYHGDETKTLGSFPIKEPCLNWICCATPDQFVKNIPTEAVGQGLLTRFLLIYYDGPPMPEAMYFPAPNDTMIESFKQDLAEIAQLSGEYTFENFEAADKWVREGMHPAPQEPTMVATYNERRRVQFIKVAMAVAAARHDDLVILEEDWERAKEMLLEEEPSMPKAYKDFGISSSAQIIREVMQHAFSDSQTKISTIRFRRILMDRAKSISEVSTYIEQMKEAGLIEIDGQLVRKRKEVS